MIVLCPHCGKQLKLGEKIRESVRSLEPGRRIKIKCAHCAVPFGLDMSMDRTTSAGREGDAAERPAEGGRIKPPPPPSTDWLKDGTFEDQDVVEDIPKAIVLMPNLPGRDQVIKAAAAVGYRVEQASTPAEAIEKMLFVNYAAVFLHSSFEPGGIRSGAFHQYMRSMNMARRRYIFYVLIGEQFQTLYDLQALSASSNIVINDADIPYINTILKKAIPEYEELFGPIMEELRIAGKA
ncbi:MAG: zinc-ribbon domain-containing protein [Proteobacteria bacterium]|nr:zinc-ribbon domain-containing protein [Pseudomonadota bacterium]